MNEVNKVVKLNDGTMAEMTVYPAVELAIAKGWESLYFSMNDESFISIKTDTKTLNLVTNGDVKFYREDDDLVLKNENQSEIRKLIDENPGKCMEDLGFEFDLNNWFCLEVGTLIADNLIRCNVDDDYVFEAVPSSMEELEELLIKIASDKLI